MGATTRVVGDSRPAGTLMGHCFVLDPTLSMVATFLDPEVWDGDPEVPKALKRYTKHRKALATAWNTK